LHQKKRQGSNVVARPRLSGLIRGRWLPGALLCDDSLEIVSRFTKTMSHRLISIAYGQGETASPHRRKKSSAKMPSFATVCGSTITEVADS
jgi:hypothetical protein